MSYILDSPSWIVSSTIVVVFSVLVSIGILRLVRSKIAIHELKKNHDVAGFTLGIIGILYSVILGFTVVGVQDRFNKVEEAVQREATLVADLYLNAAVFAPASRDVIRNNLREYVDFVLKEEWALLAEKKKSPKMQEILENIWSSYYQVVPHDQKGNIWYSHSIAKLDTFTSARLSRQFSAYEHLGDMMWSLLISGGLITMCFMFFFGLENIRSQMTMTALIAAYLSFILYLIYSLDHVYSGSVKIEPTAFEQLLSLFDRWDHLSI